QAMPQGRSAAARGKSGQTSAQRLRLQQARFETMKTESIAHLQELSSLALAESYWEVVAFQLQEALRQVSSISTETTSAPEVPLVITSLPGEMSEERIAWLRHLEELHRQREKLETHALHARNLEP